MSLTDPKDTFVSVYADKIWKTLKGVPDEVYYEDKQDEPKIIKSMSSDHMVTNKSNTIEFDIRMWNNKSHAEHKFMNYREWLESASQNYKTGYKFDLDELSENEYEKEICRILQLMPGGILELDDPTEDMIISAIRGDYKVIRYVKKQSEKIKDVYVQEHIRKRG